MGALATLQRIILAAVAAVACGPRVAVLGTALVAVLYFYMHWKRKVRRQAFWRALGCLVGVDPFTNGYGFALQLAVWLKSRCPRPGGRNVILPNVVSQLVNMKEIERRVVKRLEEAYCNPHVSALALSQSDLSVRGFMKAFALHRSVRRYLEMVQGLKLPRILASRTTLRRSREDIIAKMIAMTRLVDVSGSCIGGVVDFDSLFKLVYMTDIAQLLSRDCFGGVQIMTLMIDDLRVAKHVHYLNVGLLHSNFLDNSKSAVLFLTLGMMRTIGKPCYPIYQLLTESVFKRFQEMYDTGKIVVNGETMPAKFLTCNDEESARATLNLDKCSSDWICIRCCARRGSNARVRAPARDYVNGPWDHSGHLGPPLLRMRVADIIICMLHMLLALARQLNKYVRKSLVQQVWAETRSQTGKSLDDTLKLFIQWCDENDLDLMWDKPTDDHEKEKAVTNGRISATLFKSWASLSAFLEQHGIVSQTMRSSVPIIGQLWRSFRIMYRFQVKPDETEMLKHIRWLQDNAEPLGFAFGELIGRGVNEVNYLHTFAIHVPEFLQYQIERLFGCGLWSFSTDVLETSNCLAKKLGGGSGTRTPMEAFPIHRFLLTYSSYGDPLSAKSKQPLRKASKKSERDRSLVGALARDDVLPIPYFTTPEGEARYATLLVDPELVDTSQDAAIEMTQDVAEVAENTAEVSSINTEFVYAAVQPTDLPPFPAESQGDADMTDPADVSVAAAPPGPRVSRVPLSMVHNPVLHMFLSEMNPLGTVQM